MMTTFAATAFDLAPESCWTGVTFLPQLRDGDTFSGRAKRVARRLAERQERFDDELFEAHGGRAGVYDRLMSKWSDPSRDLTFLTSAEERLMSIVGVETAHAIRHSIEKIDPVVGYGVFAETTVRKGEVIGEYTGVLRKFEAIDVDNHYLAVAPAYGKYDGFIIDGRDEGNFTRFINHSRRAPNISNHFVFHGKRWHRLLRADRVIRPGEQLLWDYGEDYWRHREAPAELADPV